MVISRLKPSIEKIFLRVSTKLAWIPPNYVTLFGLLSGLFSIAILYYVKEYLLFLALVLTMSFMDMLDGMIARASGKTSRFGAFLDSTVDRIEDALLVIALLVIRALSPLESIVLLLGMFTISYTRARAEALGVSLAGVGLAERAERILLIIFTFLIYPLNVQLARGTLYLLLILVYVTVFQRVYFVWKQLSPR